MLFPRLARQCMSKILKGRDVMIVINVGYTKYIMENAKAVKLIELLEDAEVYENKYGRDSSGESYTTYHVYPNEDNFSMELIPATKYQLAKLAGKPNKD